MERIKTNTWFQLFTGAMIAMLLLGANISLVSAQDVLTGAETPSEGTKINYSLTGVLNSATAPSTINVTVKTSKVVTVGEELDLTLAEGAMLKQDAKTVTIDKLIVGSSVTVSGYYMVSGETKTYYATKVVSRLRKFTLTGIVVEAKEGTPNTITVTVQTASKALKSYTSATTDEAAKLTVELAVDAKIMAKGQPKTMKDLAAKQTVKISGVIQNDKPVGKKVTISVVKEKIKRAKNSMK